MTLERLRWRAAPQVRKGVIGQRPILNLENVAGGRAAVVGELRTGEAADLLAFEPGDVLFGKLRPYLSKSLLVPRPMFGTSEFLVLRCGEALNPEFLLYTTLSAPWLAWADRTSYGSKMPRTSWEAMANFSFDWPSIADQQRISHFLSDQVGLLDRAIDLRGRQIALEGERTKAHVADLVSGAADAERMVEHRLLGPVRATWPIRRLKHVVQRVGVGVVVNPSSYFVSEGGVPFVHGGNVREGGFELSDVKRLSKLDSERLSRSRLQARDVVVVRAGYPGRAAVVPDYLEGANCASVLLIRPGEHVEAKWLETYFNSPQGRSQVSMVQYGAAQEQINLGDVVEFALPVPPLVEQRALMQALTAEQDRTARLVDLMRQSVRLLRERKQALITAAVSGEFDVTTARKVSISV